MISAPCRRSKKRKVVDNSPRTQPRSPLLRGAASDSHEEVPSFIEHVPAAPNHSSWSNNCPAFDELGFRQGPLIPALPATSERHNSMSTGPTPVGPQIQDPTEGSGLRTPDKVWTSPLDFVDAPTGADGPFSEHCSSDNTVPPSAHGSVNPIPASTSDKRIVYADDTLTRSVLPHMSGHRSFNTSAGRDASNVDLGDLSMIQVTIACPRLTSSTWYERRLDQATSGPFSHLAAEDITYLCSVKHVLAFPPVDICDCLMDSFLRPSYPPTRWRTETSSRKRI